MKTLFLILLILLLNGCYQRPQVIYQPMPYPVRGESVVVPLPYFYPFPQARVLEKETIIQQVPAPQKPCNPCDTSEYDKRLKKYMEK